MKKTLFCLLFLLGLRPLLPAQDTTWVQTLTFSDIYKRQGTWLFPDASHSWRKVLMYYTLKCDPLTPWDQYDCGEWDYLTYTFVYDHRGLYDSTLKTHPFFQVGNAAPDSFALSWSPVWDYTQSWQYFITHTATQSLNTATVGSGSVPLSNVLASGSPAARAQFLWTQAELSAAGLTAGNITGLRVYVSSPGSTAGNLRVRMAHSSLDSLPPADRVDNLQTVYHLNTAIPAAGWQSLQFTQPFAWNGTDNLILDFSLDGAAGTPTVLLGSSTGAVSMGLTAAGDEHCLDFAANGGYLNLGRGVQRTGAQPRTLECWAYTRAFNQGGIFQAGPGGTTAADFSLRTMGNTDQYRVQCWGAPDFDVTAPGSAYSWHHYALSYDGSVSRVYYDGQLLGSRGYALNTGDFDILFGTWYGSFYNGKVDAIRLWNSALSAATLQAWMDRDVQPSHPNYADLAADYHLNEGAGIFTADASPAAQADGYLSGANWSRVRGSELFRGYSRSYARPNIVLEQGVYTSVLDSVAVLDSTARAASPVTLFENPANGTVIPDHSPNDPALATDTLTTWAANVWAYTYDGAGNRIDSVWVGADTVLHNQTLVWYSPTVQYEIGRFITPYGINLSLGPQGFTWVYDITDYAHLFQDSVELSAGNTQELIDLRFAFVEGTPPRPVVKIDKLWGEMQAYSYRDMDNDTVLNSLTVPLEPGSESWKLKTRLTGHGHESNDGSYPHCCEWKDNTHSVSVNGQPAFDWKIWREPGCAANPVFPQGGTWLGSREGWCPGDLVPDFEFELTPLVTGSSVTLDYDITDVPVTNQGMGSGSYVTSMQLIQYGANSHVLDAELYDVVSPNDWEYYSRRNPICNEPKVVLRNAGTTPLDSVVIDYGISGGQTYSYTWRGLLNFMEVEEVALPTPGGQAFWNGDAANRFTARLHTPNGLTDLHAANDTFFTHFMRPDTLPADFVIFFATNNRPWENEWVIRDISGNIVAQRNNLLAQWYYVDTLHFNPGCYTFEITDTGLDGIAYWADPQQGNGLLRFNRTTGGVLKAHPSEFGDHIFYPFVVDVNTHIAAPDAGMGMEVYPNPGTGLYEVDLKGLEGAWTLTVLNPMGQTLIQQSLQLRGWDHTQVDLRGAAAGVYYVQVQGEDKVITRQIILRP